MINKPINQNYYDFVIERDKDLCINCRVCERQCSYQAHYWDENRQKVMHDNTRCVGCHRCEAFCPTGALTIRQNRSEFRELSLEALVFKEYLQAG